VVIDKLMRSVQLVNVRGGIFGKTTVLLIVLCICVAAVSIKAGVWWLSLALMLPLMALMVYAIKRVFDFAERHPQAAIMDGAQFLIHERIVHARKGVEILPSLEPSLDHDLPPITGPDTQVDPLPIPAIRHEVSKPEKGE
jgi:hypothetical protein